MEGAKKVPKPDIVSYALEASVNGVTCVFSPFQVIRQNFYFVNWLNS